MESGKNPLNTQGVFRSETGTKPHTVCSVCLSELPKGGVKVKKKKISPYQLRGHQTAISPLAVYNLKRSRSSFSSSPGALQQSTEEGEG